MLFYQSPDLARETGAIDRQYDRAHLESMRSDSRAPRPDDLPIAGAVLDRIDDNGAIAYAEPIALTVSRDWLANDQQLPFVIARHTAIL